MPKLTIKAYGDEKFSNETASFAALVNPASYDISYGVSYNERRTPGEREPTISYDSSQPAVLSFELLFDSTGAIPNSYKDAQKAIDEFLKVVGYDGKIHETAYVRVIWGKLNFKSRVESVELHYTLFNSNGQALRARANVRFKSFIDEKTEKKTANKQSADLTHVVTVREGDNLPLLCQRVYDDASRYPMVAAANGLTHFQRLRPGTRLRFPPLESRDDPR